MGKKEILIEESTKFILNIIHKDIYKNIQILLKDAHNKSIAMEHLNNAAEAFKQECNIHNEEILNSLKEMMDKIKSEKKEDERTVIIEKIQHILYRTLVLPHLYNFNQCVIDLLFEEQHSFVELNSQILKANNMGVSIAIFYNLSWDISELLLRKLEKCNGETGYTGKYIDEAIEQDVHDMLYAIMCTLYYIYNEKEMPDLEF